METSIPFSKKAINHQIKDESYICVAADVHQTVSIGDNDFELRWSGGAIGEYKGRDSGDI